MANTGFKGINAVQTGSQIVFRASLKTSAQAALTTGTTTLAIYELQSDGTLKSYDFSSNTFKTTTLTTATENMSQQAGNNGSTNTGIWTYALATLTGFTVGAVYIAVIINSSASPAQQEREFVYGSAEGDLVVTSTGTGTANLNSDAKAINAVSTSSVTTVGAFVGNSGDVFGAIGQPGGIGASDSGSAQDDVIDAIQSAAPFSGLGSVDVQSINNVSTSGVTAIGANIGTTQPVNFSGTGSSAYVKGDTEQWKGATAPAMTGDAYAQLNTLIPHAFSYDSNNLPYVDAEYINTVKPTMAGAFTIPAGTLADTTNIAGGTITTVTTVTNQLTAAAITNAIFTDLWASADFTEASSFGASIKNFLLKTSYDANGLLNVAAYDPGTANDAGTAAIASAALATAANLATASGYASTAATAATSAASIVANGTYGNAALQTAIDGIELGNTTVGVTPIVAQTSAGLVSGSVITAYTNCSNLPFVISPTAGGIPITLIGPVLLTVSTSGPHPEDLFAPITGVLSNGDKTVTFTIPSADNSNAGSYRYSIKDTGNDNLILSEGPYTLRWVP